MVERRDEVSELLEVVWRQAVIVADKRNIIAPGQIDSAVPARSHGKKFV